MAFWEELSEKPVRILVGSLLPGAESIAEIDFAVEFFFYRLPIRKLGSIVGCYCFDQFRWEMLQIIYDQPCHDIRMAIGRLDGFVEPGFPFYESYETRFGLPEAGYDGIELPMAIIRPLIYPFIPFSDGFAFVLLPPGFIPAALSLPAEQLPVPAEDGPFADPLVAGLEAREPLAFVEGRYLLRGPGLPYPPLYDSDDLQRESDDVMGL